MESITRFLERQLKLKVNREKSAVNRLLAAEIPQLLHDLSREAAAQSSARISETAQGESEGTPSPW